MAFGSYGWGRGGPEAIDQALRKLDWEILREPLRARYRPTPAKCSTSAARRAGCWPKKRPPLLQVLARLEDATILGEAAKFLISRVLAGQVSGNSQTAGK